MVKQLDEPLTIEDYKKESDVSVETMQNVIESFKTYLDTLDTQELKDEDNNGKLWDEKRIEKKLKELARDCKDIVSGEVSSIDTKTWEMKSFDTSQKIIMAMVDKVNYVILLRKKLEELKDREN